VPVIWKSSVTAGFVVHQTTFGDGRGAYRFLVGRPDGKSPLGRPTRRWENNIKTVLKVVGCGNILD
jgi:hypothetical protein